MLHEYAVDPEMMAIWERVRYLLGQFGVQSGRLISRYPSHWKKMVYEAMDAAEGRGNLTPVNRTRIAERMKTIDPKMMARTPSWDSARSWTQNALIEHDRNPFRAILSDENLTNASCVLDYEELDTANLWQIEHGAVTQRTPEVVAEKLAPLARISKRLVLVDPYFDPTSRDVTSVLSTILEKCWVGRENNPFEAVEFHTVHKVEIRNFRDECANRLPRLVPRGMQLRVVRWNLRADGDGFHNRYFLTERGGIILPWGLKAGDGNETDDLMLLPQELHRHRWQLLFGDEHAYDLEDEVTYTGRR
ncbi:hypothetical protein [Rudaea sp.]|uniref:hypothetical protein n=1 Tax=Rudaea sp. TaxID=2136325 RepID=UPI0032209884